MENYSNNDNTPTHIATQNLKFAYGNLFYHSAQFLCTCMTFVASIWSSLIGFPLR